MAIAWSLREMVALEGFKDQQCDDYDIGESSGLLNMWVGLVTRDATRLEAVMATEGNAGTAPTRRYTKATQINSRFRIS